MSMRRNGFTLIEVMVVIVILGILAALVVPRVINLPGEADNLKGEQEFTGTGRRPPWMVCMGGVKRAAFTAGPRGRGTAARNSSLCSR